MAEKSVVDKVLQTGKKKSYVAKIRINTVVNSASQEKMEWYLWCTERQNLRNLEVYTHWKIL